MPALSFTGDRQLRFPAPDVARGFMLALIALANVPWWLKYFPDYPANRSELLQVMNAADQWWFIVRSLFVDRRAYPLFSILFGFGMAIMAMRTMERERRAAREAVSSEVSAGWAPVQHQIFDEEVERRAAPPLVSSAAVAGGCWLSVPCTEWSLRVTSSAPTVWSRSFSPRLWSPDAHGC